MFAGCHSPDPEVHATLATVFPSAPPARDPRIRSINTWSDATFSLITQSLEPPSPENQDPLAHQCADQGVRICAWARIDNREELIARLPDALRAQGATDTGLILAAYLHWGQQVCTHLVGDFAFAIVDQRDHTVFLGRDHLGVRPLYYRWDGPHLLFATSLAVFETISRYQQELSDSWLARYLLNCSPDWEITPFNSVHKVPPAHFLSFADNQPRLRRYFTFSPETNLHLPSADDYVEAYREALTEAVRCRTHSAHPIAAETSGGLDASAIIALATRTMTAPARDLQTYGFADCELEPASIMALSQRLPIRSTYLVTRTARTSEDEEVLWSRFWRACGSPPEHPNAFLHHFLYAPAQTFGARTLLSGFGGDEFATNSCNMARVELFLTRRYARLAQRLPGRPLAAWLRVLKLAVDLRRNHNTFFPANKLIHRAEHQWQQRVVQDRFGTPEFHQLATRDARYDSGYRTLNEFLLGNRWSPQLTARLEHSTLMAATYGLEYRWPLLDIRLLKLVLSIPAEYRLGPGGTTRYLHRQAMADLLPASVLWKDKSMGDPVTPSPPLQRPSSEDGRIRWEPELLRVADEAKLNRLVQQVTAPDGRALGMNRIMQNALDANRWLRFRRESRFSG